MFASMSGFVFGKMVLSWKKRWADGLMLLFFFVVLGIASAAMNRKREHIVSGLFVLLTVVWILIGVAGGPIDSKSSESGYGLR